jgi:hypothetical protein
MIDSSSFEGTKQAMVEVENGRWHILDTSRQEWFSVEWVKGNAESKKQADISIARAYEKLDQQGRRLCLIERREDEINGIVRHVERYCPTNFCRFIPQ